MIGGIILTHGNIGSALIQAAESIMGTVDNVYPLTTSNLSLSDINAKLKTVINAQNWDQGIIIMVSMMGGSCWNSGVLIARQIPDVEVISGVNLAMVISFLSKRDQYSLHELAKIIKEDATRGIVRLSTTF